MTVQSHALRRKLRVSKVVEEEAGTIHVERRTKGGAFEAVRTVW